jgi:MFS family permease
VIASFAMLIMACSPSLGWFSLAFLALSVANNMILAPCSALLPDVVAPEHRGIASGWIGVMGMLGSLFGGLLSYYVDTLGIFASYLVFILVHGLSTMITVYFIEEIPLKQKPPPLACQPRFASFFQPFKSRDFTIVFITRFMMQMGILTVQEYLQYYLKDAIGPEYYLNGVQVADTPEKAVSILFVPVLLGALASSLTAGFVSDQFGGRRKIIVYISGGIMGTACILFAFTRSYTFDMFLGMIFGIGFGAFSVIDWAMATDVLPSEEDFARDMGVWSLALVLPQVIAAPVAGNLLDYFEKIAPQWHLGYSMIFFLAVIYYTAGSYYVRYVEKVK